MSEQLVSDELWQIVEPLLPAEPSKARGGRPRIPDRAVLSGIVFVLRSGIPWRMLPKERGFGSRRDLLAAASVLARGGRMARFASSTSGQVGEERRGGLVEGEPRLGECARQKGGEAVGPNPTDRRKPGFKHHLLTDRNGVPLAVVLTAANVHDSKVLEELVDAVAPIKRTGRGRPRNRPEKLHADKAYDFPRCRAFLRRRGIKSRIARRGREASVRLGRHR